ncbi:MAG: glutaredoxin family protein [Candidatus Thiodiazotropha sp.]
MTNRDLKLTLYHRDGCHLCEDMRDALGEYLESFELQLIEVDIDRDVALKARYGHRIPLLLDGQGHCLSEYYLDPKRLLSYLQGR